MPKKLPIPPYSPRLKNPPYPEHVIEDLRARMRKGPVTLGREELERIIAMLERLSDRCGAAYQVVGQLADHEGLFHDPAVVRVLDALAYPLRRGEILPFDPKPVKDYGEEEKAPVSIVLPIHGELGHAGALSHAGRANPREHATACGCGFAASMRLAVESLVELPE